VVGDRLAAVGVAADQQYGVVPRDAAEDVVDLGSEEHPCQ
jgi:hypothetical protein